MPRHRLSVGCASSHTDDGYGQRIGCLQPAFDVQRNGRMTNFPEQLRITRACDGNEINVMFLQKPYALFNKLFVS